MRSLSSLNGRFPCRTWTMTTARRRRLARAGREEGAIPTPLIRLRAPGLGARTALHNIKAPLQDLVPAVQVRSSSSCPRRQSSALSSWTPRPELFRGLSLSQPTWVRTSFPLRRPQEPMGDLFTLALLFGA